MSGVTVLVDATVLALAERREMPVLAIEFVHFRATRPASGYRRLVVDGAVCVGEVARPDA